MTAVFLKLLSLAVASSPLILAVMAVRLLFKKAPKWVLCLLWAIVAIRLVLPVLPQTDFSLVPGKIGSGEIVTRLSGENGEKNVNSDSGNELSEKAEYGNETVINYRADSLGAAKKEMSLMPIFSYIWLVGAAVLLLSALLSYIRIKRRVAASVKLIDNVFVCDDISSPFILGLFRPKIYTPSSLSEKTLDCVLSHEKAHIKRHDHLWKPLGYLLLSVYWFNPLCWAAYILLCRDIESACDEKVIKDFDNYNKAVYSQSLLDCSFSRSKIAACPVAFGEIGVKARIKSVLSYKKPAFWVVLISVIVCTVVAVCFGTNPKTKSLPDGVFYAEGNDIMHPYIDISAKDKTISRGMSIYASYAERFTYKETADGIEIYDNDGLTSHKITVQEDGVIFDGVGYARSSDYLEEAISKALLSDNHGYSGEFFTEGHITLGTESLKGNIEKAYLLVSLNGFGFENGYFVDESGMIAPAVLTFKLKGRDYILQNIEYAKDGSEYAPSIKAMFPKKYHDRIFNQSEDDTNNMWLQCTSQAKAYLKEIGRIGPVFHWGDIEHMTFTDIGMPVSVSNRFEGLLKWENYYEYIGFKEVKEHGGRFIYRTSYEKYSKTLVFTKEDVFSNTVVKFARVDIKTGEVLGQMPYSLKSIYPDYYDLPTDKGLIVFVWKSSNGDYHFGLLPERPVTDAYQGVESEELLGLTGASLSDMREIISSYNIEESRVSLVPINHPLSSFCWDYEKELPQKESDMLKGMLCDRGMNGMKINISEK